MLRVGSRAADDVMKLMRENTSDRPAEQQIVSRRIAGSRRRERAANAVAFHISEGDHVTVRNVRVSQRNRLVGQGRRQARRFATSVKFDNDQAREGIRGGKLL